MWAKRTAAGSRWIAMSSGPRVIATCLALTLSLVLTAGTVTADPPTPVTPDNLVLWNRFEAEGPVLPSEVGPDVQLTSYIYSDWQEAQIVPAHFGNGLFVNHDTNEGWLNNGANFFAADLSSTDLTPQRGTIEFWFEFRYGSGTWNHAYFFDTRDTFASHYPDQNWTSDVLLAAGWNGWNYGSYGKRFFFTVGHPASSSVITAFTPDFSAMPGGTYGFEDGTVMHFGFVWDVAGIDGTSDTVRIYIDGAPAGSASGTWPAAGTVDPFLFFGSGPNCCGWDHHYNAVKGVTDNLVIWDVARTDFSGRFEENPLPNQPPDCSQAVPSIDTLWPPNHQFMRVRILGVNDPDGDPITMTIDGIFQDEMVGRAPFAPDGLVVRQDRVKLRAERRGSGNGRVYHVDFTADDGQGGSCSGTVLVSVPHDAASPAIDEGALYDSTMPTP